MFSKLSSYQSHNHVKPRLIQALCSRINILFPDNIYVAASIYNYAEGWNELCKLLIEIKIIIITFI